MRIGIDARIYGVRHGGLGRYAMRLLENLGKSSESSLPTGDLPKGGKISFAVFMRDVEWGEYKPKGAFIEKVKANIRWYSIKEQVLMPFLIKRARVDLMHFLHFNAPLWCPAPFIVTIHDLITLKRPEDRASTLPKWIYRLKWLLHRAIIRSALNRAQKVITPSEYTRGEIIRYFPSVDAQKIVVIPMGTDVIPTVAEGSHARIKRDSSTSLGMTVLYLGVAFPHKNLETLIRAFALMRRHTQNETLTHAELIIAGPKSFFFTRLQKWAETKGLDQRVRFVESPTDEEREKLFGEAALFAYPSLEEGFGLPPLEAMARGVPVVASRRASLSEVLGDAALSVEDPENPEELAHAMELVLKNESLRRELVVRGQKQVARYSWEETTKKTLVLYLNTALHSK